jgi:hypothetical protein
MRISKMQKIDIRLDILIVIGLVIFIATFFANCSSRAENRTATPTAVKNNSVLSPEAKAAELRRQMPKGALIEIKENSPADTVRVFYQRLREEKFRDAIVLTNLRPAVEGLTEAELKDLGVDFGFLARSVPENLPINGEIVTGDQATVTVQMPDDKEEKIEVQEIKLRKEKDFWIVLVADDTGERRAKREGKNYFFSLRMDVHHEEARAMLERINKAQAVFQMQNNGRFGDLRTLVEKGYVPRDALGSLTTGYTYDIALKEERTLYTALATPAEYGKTGKLSFAFKVSRGKQPELVARDVRGKPLKN